MSKPSISAEEGYKKLSKAKELQDKHREREDKFEKLFAAAKNQLIVSIDYNDINTNFNIRDEALDENDFQLLKNSIKEHGILQNIIVELQECEDSVFQLVCLSGHRRIAALKSINESSELFRHDADVKIDDEDEAQEELKRASRRVQCKVKLSHNLAQKWKLESSQTQNFEAALSENLLRRDMHFFEKASAFKMLVSSGLTPEEVEQKFIEKASESVSVRTINRLIGLFDIIPPEGQKLVLKHKDLFPLRYMLENFLEHKNAKKRNGPTIVRMIEGRINGISKRTHQKEKATSVTRIKKVESFLTQNKVSKKEKERVLQALEFVGYIKSGDFPRAVESSPNP